MHRAVLLALLPLAACTTADAATEAAPAPSAYEAIAFEINSWGRPLGSWEARADGTVRHLEVEGSVFGAHTNEHRAFTVDAADYARLAALAATLPQPRLQRADCKEQATDLPYGTLHLTSGGAAEDIPFDTGCLDKPYRAFVDKLQAMDELVGGWAEQRPANRVEQVAR
jgi:hypothetical protein